LYDKKTAYAFGILRGAAPFAVALPQTLMHDQP
jgi:hypothetical protein